MKNFIALAAMIFAPCVFAWDSPSEAVSQFLKFDLAGGRLSSEHWNEYVTKYIAAPEEYDEPGWDEATVVSDYKLLAVTCETELRCSAKIQFKLHPTRNLHDPNVAPHNSGGTLQKKYVLVRRNNSWLAEPPVDSPIILLETYKKHRAALGH